MVQSYAGLFLGVSGVIFRPFKCFGRIVVGGRIPFFLQESLGG